jgi:uncharacterized protein (TIGR00369 family)
MPRALTSRAIRERITLSPYLQLLGARLARTHADGITLECPVRDDLRNVIGGLHGGVAASLADAAVGFALQRHFGGVASIATVELKINYFAPVIQGSLFARARLLRVGSRICVGAVDLTDSKRKPVGAALVTYMLLNATTKPAAKTA